MLTAIVFLIIFSLLIPRLTRVIRPILSKAGLGGKGVLFAFALFMAYETAAFLIMLLNGFSSLVLGQPVFLYPWSLTGGFIGMLILPMLLASSLTERVLKSRATKGEMDIEAGDGHKRRDVTGVDVGNSITKPTYRRKGVRRINERSIKKTDDNITIIVDLSDEG